MLWDPTEFLISSFKYTAENGDLVVHSPGESIDILSDINYIQSAGYFQNVM